jgi:large subunit ribosomal protein L16
MLSPKRVKHRKVQRGRVKGEAHSGNEVSFGEYGLVCQEPMWITNRQLEAARVALNRSIKRGGKLWIRIFPDKPFSKKPLEVRMGKGKGGPEYWVAVVRPGTMMFELAGVPKRCRRRGHASGGKQAADKDEVRRPRRHGDGVSA